MFSVVLTVWALIGQLNPGGMILHLIFAGYYVVIHRGVAGKV